MILIKNATLINAGCNNAGDNVRQNVDILAENGVITKIGKDLAQNHAECSPDNIIDATGLTVIPGLIDVHAHFRDPGFTHKEDILTGAEAAGKGGFTTVVLMANTNPVVDSEKTLAYVLEKGKQTPIRIETCASITKGLKGKELTDMTCLREKGAAGFTDDGIPILDTEILERAMKEAAELGVVLSLHEEDPAFIRNNGINEGAASASLGISGSHRQAEISMIERDVKMALETGATLNVQHISTKEGVEIIRQARKVGDNIHAEATPHHFALTEEAVCQYGSLAKMNPPLRTEEDRLAIIKGLQEGVIDVIATDHAPHSQAEKEQEITKAPSGIIGLETALGLAMVNLVETGYLTISELVEKMSFNPAKLYRLNAGVIREGGPCDLVVFNPDEEFEVTEFVSKSSNSPFLNARLKGKIYYTICDGEIVYRDWSLENLRRI